MRLAACLTSLFFVSLALSPVWAQTPDAPQSAEAARAELPALRATAERTGRAKDRIALALALEAAGDKDGALAEGLAVVAAFGERSARGKNNRAALSAAFDLMERIRVSREAAPVLLTLPVGCERPTVRMGELPIEVKADGASATARLPPNAGATTTVAIDCGAPDDADHLGPETDWAPYLFGGALVSAAASAVFTARFLSAENDLETPAPIVDPSELGPEAQRLTRARQSRDDFGTAAVAMGVVAAGLTAWGLYLSFGNETVSATPTTNGSTLGVSLGGVF